MNLIGALWVIPLALILLAVVARMGPTTGRQQVKTTTTAAKADRR